MDREHFCKGKDRAFPGEEASAAGYYWHGRREAVMNGRLGNDLPKAFSTALHERGHGAYALGASQLPLESCGETRYVGEDYSRFVWRCFREGAIDMLALESRDHDFTVTRERAFLPEGGEISLDRVATEDTIMCKLSLIENAGYSPEGFVEYLRMNDGHLQCRERTAARGCEDRQLARLQAFIDSHPRSAHAHQARLDRADILWRLTVHDAYRNELGRVPSGTPFPATARELTALLDMPMIELNRGVFVPRSLSAALESLQKDSLGESVPGRAYLWWDVAEGCVASPSECAALEKGLDRYWRKRDALRERLFEEPPYRRWLGRLVAQNS